jgi:hypothetical protein
VTPTPERTRTAQAILAIPLFDEMLNELETTAINQAVFAKYDDHEARQAHLAQVRAIRDLRSSIEILAKADQSIDRRKAPA